MPEHATAEQRTSEPPGSEHPRLRVEVLLVLPFDLACKSLAGYKLAYALTDKLAAAANRVPDEEFLQKMVDKDITKFVALDRADEPLAMATLTGTPSYRLSPAFYEARYPEHFASGRIWYMAQFWAQKGHRGGVIAILRAVSLYASGKCVIVAFNCCNYNTDVVRVPEMIA